MFLLFKEIIYRKEVFTCISEFAFNKHIYIFFTANAKNNGNSLNILIIKFIPVQKIFRQCVSSEVFFNYVYRAY